MNSSLARDVHGVSYLPGFVGLNNLHNTDYASVVLHCLAHVEPIRTFFMDASNYDSGSNSGGGENLIVTRFGEVLRKMWSSSNFKSVVSPQEFLQVVICVMYVMSSIWGRQTDKQRERQT